MGILIVLLVGSLIGLAVASALLKKAEKDGKVGLMGW
jgi:uncharacterized membrane protein YeaQ/YmgE (transglycosylase-associated protein family)